MPISIIFPIDLGSPPLTPNPRLGVQGGAAVVSKPFGAASYPDWSQTDAIKQNLKMLLLTRPGEYVMDANYGVGLPDYLFELEELIDTAGLEAKIRSQASTYMPYMTISNLSVTIEPSSTVMRIRIEFFYNELRIPEVFELEVI